ncbi:hypothetical protein EIB18_11860 [Caulobacter vibrioides]|nr:hypothetical protein CA608_12205 [Caulobacter vibrioides]AZH13336.1 hypothetical protein EIB18_11860 [Caulobacter vibrioides]PLR14009.1 hypothetical protein CVUC_05505 [Caulobacter vibrioides]
MTNILVISTRRLVMKKNAQRTPATRTQKLAIGMAASSGSLVVAIGAAREMGGPLLAAGLALGLAALGAVLFLVLRERPSKGPKDTSKSEQDGAVEALAAL